jgi:hypothetical protein
VKWRTQTRPNGQKDHRETLWGLDAVIPVLGLLAAVIAAWVSLNREVSTLAAEQKAFHDEFIRDGDSVQRASEKYITKDTWEQDRERQDEALRDALAVLQHQLEDFSYTQRRILNGQYDIRNKVEKLPPRQEEAP